MTLADSSVMDRFSSQLSRKGPPGTYTDWPEARRAYARGELGPGASR